ncbi:MAG: YdeI/OmpD-associated family protein [Mucilaginibacter sp.]|uniref:YdeI/OmpD-associated family protein n=1 Tax=Mucilaginibacter sp. TaxID=1882438 RepID=UPI0031A7B1F1
MNEMNPKVDFYFNTAEKWQDEIERLRTIILDCGLTEELKWGCPCYTFEGNNVVLIHVFKEYCAVLFFKGALLNNVNGILIQQSENVQAARQARFTNAVQVIEHEAILKAHILEAIEVEKAGLKVNLKSTADYEVPEEFQSKLDRIPALKTAFEALTPGRQRAYLFHFSKPKQSKTREQRVENCIPQILNGKGLNDE